MQKDLISHNKDVYNRIAPHFASTRSFVWQDIKGFAQYITSGDRVLDIGCGNGRVYQLCKKLQAEYVGMDQSEALVAIARQNFPEVLFDIGEMTHLPYPDASFDVIICVATFNHLPDVSSRMQALTEMRRVLCPGGVVLMTNWNLLSAHTEKYLTLGKWHKIDNRREDVMIPWFTATGTVVGERYYHGYILDELYTLFSSAGFVLGDQYYGKKGTRSDSRDGHNIITVAHAPWTGVPSAGGVVVRKEGNTYLVALERDMGLDRGEYWFIPKGHMDTGETLEQTARREIHEEVGIADCQLVQFLTKTERKAYIGDEWKNMYYFLYTTDQIELSPIATDKKHEARWVDLFQDGPISSLEEQERVFAMVREKLKIKSL